MRSFKEYLTESAKKYDFRVKVAGEFTSEQEAQLKGLLERFSIAEFKKVGKTPIQDLPLDFPKLKNMEVTVFELSLNYPSTQFELTEYLTSGLKLNRENLIVRKPGEPLEEYQEKTEERNGALLDDPDYKELPKTESSEFYGEKYNTAFLKTLVADAEARRKARGEKVPAETAAKFSTDAPAGTHGPISGKGK